MGTKISALPAASALAGTEIGPIVQSGATVKATMQSISNLPPVYASGTVVSWNSDTGISRDSAGVIDFGNGTQGDQSGTIIASRAGFGVAPDSTHILIAESDQNATTAMRVTNRSTGTAALAQCEVTNSTHVVDLDMLGTGWTTSGIFQQDGAILVTNGNGGLTLGTQIAQPIYFAVNNAEVGRFSAQGSLVLGSGALATNATDGFLYIPTCAGTPTGTPTAQTGRVAMIYDTTNHQFWIYDGGWKQPKTPAGAATVTWQ